MCRNARIPTSAVSRSLVAIALVFLFCACSQAAQVRNYFIRADTGLADTNYLIITQISTNILASGGVTTIGVPIRAPRSPYTNYLAQGFYSVSNAVLRRAYVINVWDNSSTLYDYTNFLHSGYNTYVTPPADLGDVIAAIGYQPQPASINLSNWATLSTNAIGTGSGGNGTFNPNQFSVGSSGTSIADGARITNATLHATTSIQSPTNGLDLLIDIIPATANPIFKIDSSSDPFDVPVLIGDTGVVASAFYGNAANVTGFNANQFATAGGTKNLKTAPQITNAVLYGTHVLLDPAFGVSRDITYAILAASGNPMFTINSGGNPFPVPVLIGATGIVAHSFHGSGAGLTGIPLTGLAQSGAISGQIPKWNGSAWVASTDSVGAGGNNTNSIAINVNSLGIYGGSTDEATAIQAAIDTGLPLWFPPTNYTVRSNLTLKDNSIIYGYGATLEGRGVTDFLDYRAATNWSLIGIRIAGTNYNAVAFRFEQTTRKGILVDGNHGGQIKDCEIVGWDDGIYGVGSQSATATYKTPLVRITGSLIQSNSTGIRLNSASSSTLAEYFLIDGNTIQNNNRPININSANNTVVNNRILNNTGPPVINGASGLNNGHGIFAGNTVNHSGGLAMTNINTSGYPIQGNQIRSGSIYMHGCNGVDINGNALSVDYIFITGSSTTANIIRNNTYTGIWKTLPGGGPSGDCVVLDYAGVADTSPDVQHYGNYSTTVAGDGDGVGTIAATVAADAAALTNLNASSLASGVVGSSRGGAGTVNGVMKANGSGVVSAAAASDLTGLWTGLGVFMTRFGTNADASGAISGTDTRVLFFDGTDNPSGDAGFTYNKTTDTATLVGSLGAKKLLVGTTSTSHPELASITGGRLNSIVGSNQFSFIGGGDTNYIEAGTGGASVAANGGNVIVGGHRNYIGYHSTNAGYVADCFIGAGTDNHIFDNGHDASVISGGLGNTISAASSVIGGGTHNLILGNFAVIPGGADNYAGGENSVAMGYKAGATNNNVFVWSDGTAFGSTAANQFLVRATGGVGIGTNAPQAALHVAGGARLDGRIVQPAITLTDAATIATDASLGNVFRVTLGGNRTLGNPTNPLDNQEATWEITQDGTGSRTLSLGSDFAFGADITGIILSTTASKTDFLKARYNSSAGKWRVVGFIRGY